MQVDLIPRKKIIIADDHTVIATGLKLILKNNFQVNDIHVIHDLKQLIPSLKTNNHSHLILDITFPEDSSINYIDQIKVNFPKLSILLFTMHPSHLFQNILIKYPDIFFCQKSANENTLFRTIQAFVYNNQKYSKQTNPIKKWKLSKNEEVVTRLLIEGKSTGQIAETLNIKSNTVSTYKKRIFEKTDAQNILELSKIFQ